MTTSGKLLLRNWICHPLKIKGIYDNDRHNAVEDDVMANSDVFEFEIGCCHPLKDQRHI